MNHLWTVATMETSEWYFKTPSYPILFFNEMNINWCCCGMLGENYMEDTSHLCECGSEVKETGDLCINCQWIES